ncbi:hypothetical protein ACRQGT_02300, partial [Actinotignum sp. GS-2025c]|uniref:hypothetical protein n=1 Tax=Actinotignum sp. GS-2025c TaxID=3427276 RepID=UPI003F4489FA
MNENSLTVRARPPCPLPAHTTAALHVKPATRGLCRRCSAPADKAMKILEDAGHPYSILAGNHDVG